MLVAVLLAAIEFVLEIEFIADVVKVLLLSAANLDESDLSQNSIRVIESESNCAIRKTTEVTSMLYLNAKNIDVFPGAGQSDLPYTARTKDVDAEYVDQFNAPSS